MFCPNCGSEMANGTACCTHCGEPLPLSAPAKTKMAFSPLKLAILILTAVCAVAMIASYFIVVNTSIEDIAVFSILPEEILDDVDEAKDELNKSLNDFERRFDDNRDEIDDKYEDLVDENLEIVEDLTDKWSIQNLKKAIKHLEKVDEEVDERDLKELGIDLDGIEDAGKIMNVLSNVILFTMLFCLVFCVCGGLFRIKGLVITGMIFSIFYALPFCGMLGTMVFVAIDVALIVLITRERNS